MTEDSTKKIQSKIRSRIDSREEKDKMIKQGRVVSEQFPNAYRMMGHDSRAAAVYYFHLGECDSGRTEFQNAADYYKSCVQALDENGEKILEGRWVNLRYLLHAALLSGDNSLVENAAEYTLDTASGEIDSSSMSLHYYYVLSLATEIKDADNQRMYLNNFHKKIEDTNSEYTEEGLLVKYDACYRTLLGIADGNKVQVSNGIDAVLAHHADRVPADTTRSKDLVSIYAAALVVLARQGGLDVEVSSKYVPNCVDEIV